MGIIGRIFKGISLRGILNDILDEVSSGGNVIEATDQMRPGDVGIIGISLVSHDGSKAMDMMQHVKTVDIYESILNPTVFAEFGIADSIGIEQDFPLKREEYMQIEFKTPSSSVSTKYKLRVRDIVNKVVLPNNLMTTYTIVCAHEDVMSNADKLVLKNTRNISDAVKDILKDYIDTDLPMDIEPTKGIKKRRVPRLHPYAAINFLRGKAITALNYSTSTFYFFMNKYGYKFASLERMFAEGEKDRDLSDKTFFFDNTSSNLDTQNLTLRNIIAYNRKVGGDMSATIGLGGFNSLTQRLDTISFDLDDIQFRSQADNTPGGQSASFRQQVGQNTPVSRLVPYSSEDQDPGWIDQIGGRNAFALKFTQGLTQIEIYGDTDLTVGDVITCTLPAARGAGTDTSGNLTAPEDTGTYLISDLRHMIVLGDRPQHIISCELIKSSVLN